MYGQLHTVVLYKYSIVDYDIHAADFSEYIKVRHVYDWWYGTMSIDETHSLITEFSSHRLLYGQLVMLLKDRKGYLSLVTYILLHVHVDMSVICESTFWHMNLKTRLWLRMKDSFILIYDDHAFDK